MGPLLFSFVSVMDPSYLSIVDHRQPAVSLVTIARHALHGFEFAIESIMSSAGVETMLWLVSLVTMPEEAGVALHIGYCFQGFTPEGSNLLD